VLRALLRCVACSRLEVAYLNEFESDLFLHHHSVARLCGQCGGWTTWIWQFPESPEGMEESGVPDAGRQITITVTTNGSAPKPWDASAIPHWEMMSCSFPT